jgi:hypothetical protein
MIKSKVDCQTLLLYPASNTEEKEDNGFIATWYVYSVMEKLH